MVKSLPASAGNARDNRFNPWVRKIPWSRNGNPLQCSCLGNPMDRGAWQAIAYGIAKESDTTEHIFMHA